MKNTNTWIYGYLAKEGKDLETLKKNLLKGTKAEMVSKAQEIGLTLDVTKTKADMTADVIEFLTKEAKVTEEAEEMVVKEEAVVEVEAVEEVEEVQAEETEAEESITEETSIIPTEVLTEEEHIGIIAGKKKRTAPSIWSAIKTLAPIIWAMTKTVAVKVVMFAIWAFYQAWGFVDALVFYGPLFWKKGSKVVRIALTSSVRVIGAVARVSANISTLILQWLSVVVLVALGGCLKIARVVTEGWQLRQAIIAEEKAVA